MKILLEFHRPKVIEKTNIRHMSTVLDGWKRDYNYFKTMREIWGVKMNLHPEIALARPKWFIWSHLACTIDVWRWTFSHSLFFLFRLKKCRTTVQSRKRWRADIWFLSCVEFRRIFRTRYVRQWVEIRDPWQFSLDVMKTVFKMRSDQSKHVTSVSQSHVWNSIEAATQKQIDIFSKKYNAEQERLFKDRFHVTAALCALKVRVVLGDVTPTAA